MNFSAGTSPVLVRQVTVAVSVMPVITQDMVVPEPFFTSLFTDSTSARCNRVNLKFRPILFNYATFSLIKLELQINSYQLTENVHRSADNCFNRLGSSGLDTARVNTVCCGVL